MKTLVSLSAAQICKLQGLLEQEGFLRLPILAQNGEGTIIFQLGGPKFWMFADGTMGRWVGDRV